MQETRRTNQERSEATRQALVGAARELFVRFGYADTSTPEIAAAAGITRGALYHHFEDKRALFRAVVEEEARAVADHILQNARTVTSGLESLLKGADAYLDAMTVPGRTRLLLLDGPAVLGADVMQQIDEETSAQTLRDGLQAAMRRPQGVAFDRLSPLLSAAFDRAALEIEAGENPRSVKTAMKFILRSVVEASTSQLAVDQPLTDSRAGLL